ncbi:transcriptional regulator [Amylibacter kogurei]|uniref:histidine kinase n=1 Tax=Paramylibacter kogurei TaxID=1889778 RepID=A0A2G5K6U0_9RHOB|nr:helix-turn-helix transcriptional regulator [Amylibacter kogurei]PIB24600.1 transcriptional regulator [Amylibacter kogurei]
MARTHLGTRIRENRKSKNLSQKDLASLAGISASYLNLIEHNRRSIAGKTLIALAKGLGIDAQTLSEGMDTSLIDRVKRSGLKMRGFAIETDRSAEFAARFPGFARLIARLQDQVDQQEQQLTALADQMHHDPFFAEAMHLMLSNITTIRSTAEILANETDVPIDVARRFMDNLRDEANRLSTTVSDVLEHFEPSSETQSMTQGTLSFEALLEQNNHFLTDLEYKTTSADALIENTDGDSADRDKLRASINSYVDMAHRLPIDPFMEQAKQVGYDPLVLAQMLNTDISSICFRLAHMPTDADVPKFGLLQCDGSGAVLYRKQLSTFNLPRFGGACALWPVYRCMSQTGQPVSAFLDMPTGERFYTFSISYPVAPPQIGMPAQNESIMLFTANYELLANANFAALPQLAVGLQCTVCPRPNCTARRDAYLLGKS